MKFRVTRFIATSEWVEVEANTPEDAVSASKRSSLTEDDLHIYEVVVDAVTGNYQKTYTRVLTLTMDQYGKM